MPLATGAQLGPYEILSPIGAGGMGEVYKARDTRLDRTVAVKVLPDHIANRDDSRARFEREARAVASLNHPNICTLHDIGPNYMVMEMIEGETLAARIEKGPIPLDQAVSLATQIADALDRAHRAGVTHRDVKPHNIMLTRDGVKVLDFGLAKAVPTSPGPSEATLTKALTAEGTVVGTPQYMAPEQFEGKEADARSDIWAFGAVLYEMVTGQKAFQGKNYTSLVANILGGEPLPMAVKPFAPAWLERLVRRCLQKDPEDRWQTMRDVVIELKSPPAEVATAPAKSSRVPWAIAAALAVAVVGIALTMRSGPAAEAEPMEFVIEDSAGASELILSPDGKMLAWVGNDAKLRVRPLVSAQTRVGGDTGVRGISWSPDSRNVAYRHFETLKSLDVRDFTSRIVTQPVSGNDAGTAWTSDGHILIASTFEAIRKVRASGGDSAPVFPQVNREAGGNDQRFPAVLGDGKHVLYAVAPGSSRKEGIYLWRLDGQGKAKRLRDNAPFRYLSPNAMLVYANGSLSLVQFDLETGKTSDPVPLAGDFSGLASFAISADGRSLAFVKGSAGAEQIALYDRSGKKRETILEAQPTPSAHVEMSPDGRRLLFERMTGKNTDVWTLELGRNVVSRLTSDDAAESSGSWSADGQKAYFRSEREGREGIYEIPYNGAGTQKLIHKGLTHHLHASPDGKYIILERGSNSTALDILDLASGKVSEYLATPAFHPQFSPDSRYVAYESNETGRREIYVQTFPRGKGKWQISTDGGRQPRWRGDGKEIYFVDEGKVMAAAIETGNGSLEVSSTTELFSFRLTGSAGTALAVSADGKVFAIREGSGGTTSPIVLKLNVKLPGR